MKPKVLPTYLVVDVSNSMTPHQDTLNETLDKLHATLAESPRVSEFAHVSIIAFSTTPQVVVEMTNMERVPAVPEMTCNGVTNYGAAFDLVRERVDIDVPALNAQDKSVLRPAVFFLTDGEPNDSRWKDAFARLVDPAWSRHPHVITYGFGAAPTAVLSKIATKMAFRADAGTDQRTALSEAINSLLNSLVASSSTTSMQIPTSAPGYTAIPLEYMD